MIYVICILAGIVIALAALMLLLQFQRTGDAVKKIVEKISRHKAKSSLGKLNEEYLEILKY